MDQTRMGAVTELAAETDNFQQMVEKLNLKLDSLWERYLNLLDEYQTARVDLLKELSSVFVLLFSYKRQ